MQNRKKGWNVVSLFDGIACARVALKKRGIKVANYYASEIDKDAILVALDNHPAINHVGGVQTFSKFNFPHIFSSKIDLLIGGSPCQDLSIAKKNRQGLKGNRSGLFWEYVRLLKELKPRYFILENVASMSKEDKQVITDTLGVEAIMIDAALVSAQRRKRLFWTNIPNVTLPKDRGIFLKDILQKNVKDDMPKNYIKWLESSSGKRRIEKGFIKINPEKAKGLMARDYANWSGNLVLQYRRFYWRETEGGKVPTLTANMGMGMGGHNVPFIEQTARGKNAGGKKFGKVPTLSSSSWEHNHKLNGIRKLTPIECERLQSLPDDYTSAVSNSQRYKALGNAFNVDVIAHILSFVEKL